MGDCPHRRASTHSAIGERTMKYHRAKGIFHVMQTHGHKNIKNILMHVQLAEELFKDQQENISKVARTEVDACTLVGADFEFVCDFDGAKIFRKY